MFADPAPPRTAPLRHAAFMQRAVMRRLFLFFFPEQHDKSASRDVIAVPLVLTRVSSPRTASAFSQTHCNDPSRSKDIPRGTCRSRYNPPRACTCPPLGSCLSVLPLLLLSGIKKRPEERRTTARLSATLRFPPHFQHFNSKTLRFERKTTRVHSENTRVR